MTTEGVSTAGRLTLKWLYRCKIGDRYSVMINDKIHHCVVVGFTPMIVLPNCKSKSGSVYPIMQTSVPFKKMAHRPFVGMKEVECTTFVLTPDLYEDNKVLNEGNLEMNRDRKEGFEDE